MQLLTEDETGELVASGYPSEIDAGNSIPLVVAVENQEGQAMGYTAVVRNNSSRTERWSNGRSYSDSITVSVTETT
ncbi:DUF1616 domain-containing protein [Natrinema sp. HArc-T2]|uniref:DUF1616 domain-containing protein n=1 Tax=Natrinema sp. HArc-T2 TaxID=3242701 RepID=UPI00359D6976